MSEIKSQLDSLKIDRQPEPEGSRRGVWIAVAAVLLLVLVAAGWWLARPGAAEVTVAVAREVEIGERQTVLNASGYVTARRQATVSSKVTGKVVEVLIEEGMAVDEGQVLARLDDTNVAAALRLSEAQLDQATAALAETRVRLAEAELNLERAERLVADRVASQADLDAASAEAASLAARLESQGEAVRVAERQVALGRQSLEDTVIRAPFAGIVVAKNAQPGEMISPAAAGGGFTRTGIGTIVDMGSLEIEVDVNEAYINRVRPGQRVTATLDAYPDWAIPCEVIAIIPTADRQKATVQVRIGFTELDERVLPDMGVKVAFQAGDPAAGQSRKVVALPRTALRVEDGQDVVFVVRQGRLERRAVKVGQSEGAEAVILTGLTAGERVVLDGPTDLAEGDEVKEISG